MVLEKEKNGIVKMILLLIILLLGIKSFAQEGTIKNVNEVSYQKVVEERASKIVKTLEITDSVKFAKVRDIIANQYKNLNAFHEERKLKLKEISLKKENTKAVNDSIAKEYLANSEIGLSKIHDDYLKKLRTELSKKQIEGVKNGMTYSVFPNTFRAYQDMMPDLSHKQKKQVYNYLYEAREHAMDAESAEKKHAWFGKYKGRINNYLSKEGIDMKEVSLAWEKRIRAAEEAKKNKTANMSNQN